MGWHPQVSFECITNPAAIYEGAGFGLTGCAFYVSTQEKLEVFLLFF